MQNVAIIYLNQFATKLVGNWVTRIVRCY